MPRATREELLNDQYKTADNLNARIRLHELFSVNKQGWQNWVYEQLALPGSGAVLELGCGAGTLWRDNAARTPAALSLTLTDFSIGMITAARATLAALARPINYAVADAHAIPFPDAAFDVVIANHMLYYVADRPRAFAEIRRVLRPAGRFYATTVGETHMQELRGLLTGFDPTIDYDGDFAQSIPFTLESGLPEMQQAFPGVELRRYDDELRVTDPAPLTDYLLSMLRTQANIAAARRADLARYVADQVGAVGVFKISKSSGLFAARP